MLGLAKPFKIALDGFEVSGSLHDQIYASREANGKSAKNPKQHSHRLVKPFTSLVPCQTILGNVDKNGPYANYESGYEQ